MLPSFGMKNRGKGARAVLSIGKHVDKTSQRTSIYLMICTAKDRAGSKYKVSVEEVSVPETPRFDSSWLGVLRGVPGKEKVLMSLLSQLEDIPPSFPHYYAFGYTQK